MKCEQPSATILATFSVLLVLSGAMAQSAGCGLSTGSAGQTDSYSMLVNGLLRDYTVHLPSGYNANSATPVVLGTRSRRSTDPMDPERIWDGASRTVWAPAWG